MHDFVVDFFRNNTADYELRAQLGNVYDIRGIAVRSPSVVQRVFNVVYQRDRALFVLRGKSRGYVRLSQGHARSRSAARTQRRQRGVCCFAPSNVWE